MGIKKDVFFRDMVRVAYTREELQSFLDRWRPLVLRYGDNVQAAVGEIFEGRGGLYKELWTEFLVESPGSNRNPITKAYRESIIPAFHDIPAEDPLAQRHQRLRYAQGMAIDTELFIRKLEKDPLTMKLMNEIGVGGQDQIRNILDVGQENVIRNPQKIIQAVQDVLEKGALSIAYKEASNAIGRIEDMLSQSSEPVKKMASDSELIRRVVLSYLNDLDRRHE